MLFVAFLLYVIVYYLLRYLGLDAQKIQDFVSAFGLSGYIAIFLSQLIASFTPLPDSPIGIMSILLYGPIVGSAIVYSAMLVAAILQYFLARRLGQKYVTKHVPKADRYIKKLNEGGHIFSKLVAIRVFSIVPVDLASYVAGVAGISFGTYFFSTLIGLIPVLINIIILSRGLYANDLVELIITGIIYLSFVFTTWLASHLLKKYRKI